MITYYGASDALNLFRLQVNKYSGIFRGRLLPRFVTQILAFQVKSIDYIGTVQLSGKGRSHPRMT